MNSQKTESRNLRKKQFAMGFFSKQLFSKEFVVIYLVFFVFFFLQEIADLGGDLYLTENGEFTFLSGLKIFNILSLTLLPLLIVRLNAKIGNIRVVKAGFSILLLAGVSIFLGHDNFYYYLFAIPLVTRFLNSGLNPYLIKKIKQTEGLQDGIGKIFAVRDLFLFLGAASGSIVGALLNKIYGSYTTLFRVSSILIVVLLLLAFFGWPNWVRKTSKSPEKETPAAPALHFRDIRNKRALIVIVTVSCLTSFTGAVFAFLPTIALLSGLEVPAIFSSYFIGYLFIAIFSYLLAAYTPNSKKKAIYVFDLVFDVIPLGLILFSFENITLMSAAIVLLIGRDFVKPISMDYTYSLFNEDEIDYLWGILGTIPNLVSLGFIALMPVFLAWNRQLPILLAIGVSVVVTLLASLFLPPIKNVEKNSIK